MSLGNLILFGLVNFVATTLSGISGGGGFIVTPVLIFLGLTPQQAIASGKLAAVALSLGSLQKLHKAKLHNWRVVAPIMILAAVIGLAAPYFIVRLENDFYEKILGILLIVMIPVLYLTKSGQVKKELPQSFKTVGWVLIAVLLATSAIFSGGAGSLVTVAMMMFLGMSALEANVTRRFSQLALNALVFLGVIGSGLMVWDVAVVGAISAFFGGQLGSHLALKKGDRFVLTFFAIFMFISGLVLLLG